MRKRLERQDAIRRIVRRERIRTQRELVDRLKAQASCARRRRSRATSRRWDCSKLPEGVYVLAEDLHLQRMISELVSKVSAAATRVS